MTATPIQIPLHHQAAVAAGAECWRCPLNNCGRGPVMATMPDGPVEILVVAEAPGSTEVAEGRPLCGASGREIRQALTNAHAPMNRVGYTNALMCQPPGDLKKYLQAVKRAGQDNPIDCCRPRLRAELDRAKFAILMGGASLQAAQVKASSIMKVRGTPIEIPGGPPALGIPHAAFVMRDEGRTFRPLFHADVNKAVRIAYSGSTWKDPWYFVPRTAVEVENFLAHRERSAVDVETDGIDAWKCGLRRVGIGDDKEVMIYSPLSVRGHELLSKEEQTAQSRAIAAYLQRAPRIDTHNGITFDSLLMWRHGMAFNESTLFDGLVAHQVGPTSELPHSLDFLGSMYTDAPYWKDDVKHSSVRDDETLNRYLSYDIAVTYAAEPFLLENLRASQQEHIYSLDAELFRIGRSMSALGLYVDLEARWKFAAEYQEKANRVLAEFYEIAGREVNPNSPKQIQQLLYRDLGLPILDEHVTDSGDPSTDESTLLDLLAVNPGERATKIIHGILGCREAEKILGTYTGHIVNGELEGGPIMHADGCIRPTNRPGKRSGRWGSNDPNIQNWPKRLREMIVAKPGNVLVAADMSALELRLIALLAGDEPLIKAFAEFDAGTGPDVHVFNATTVFKCEPAQVTDGPRRFIKCVAAGSRVPVVGAGLIKIENLVAPTAIINERGEHVATELHDVGTTECLRIITNRGLSVEVAKRHRVQLDTGEWRWADELKVGDTIKIVLPVEALPSEYVKLPINPRVPKSRRARDVELSHELATLPQITIEERLAYLLGSALGDGTITKGGSALVGLIDDGVIAEAKRCAEELGLPTYYQKKAESAAGELGVLHIISPNWKKLLLRLGMHDGTAKVLRVPDVIFRSPRSVIIAFLAGMFDTDGTVGELNVCSKSQEFVHDMAILLGAVGLQGTYEEAWNKTYLRMYYRLRLRRYAAVKLLEMGGMRAKGKLARQRAKMNKWGTRVAADPPPLVAKVLRVEPAGMLPVYDLTVPDTLSYVANGIVNHNSFVYALSYDAQPPKIYQTLSLMRDDNFKPLFGHITLAEVQRIFNLWWQLHPAIPAWKKTLVQGWRRRGYIETPYHKRRRFFIGGEKVEEMGNHPVQGGGADMQNDAIKGLVAAYPFDFVNHRGLLVNGHDQLVVECAAREAEDVKRIVQNVMQKRIGGMLFPAVPKSGANWKAVS